MIKDKLKNAHIYYPMSENLKKGLEWLISQDLVNIEPKNILLTESLFGLMFKNMKQKMRQNTKLTVNILIFNI